MPESDETDRTEARNPLRRTVAPLVYRLQTISVLGYMGAASIIGIEALALVIGFTTALPIAIPFVVVVLGAAYFLRERLRALWARVTGRPAAADEGES